MTRIDTTRAFNPNDYLNAYDGIDAPIAYRLWDTYDCVKDTEYDNKPAVYIDSYTPGGLALIYVLNPENNTRKYAFFACDYDTLTRIYKIAPHKWVFITDDKNIDTKDTFDCDEDIVPLVIYARFFVDGKLNGVPLYKNQEFIDTIHAADSKEACLDYIDTIIDDVVIG